MWIPYAWATAAMVVMAVAGMRATDIGPWYRNLDKPSWHPPDWVFGPAWTTIYVLIVAAVGRTWNAADAGEQTVLLVLLAINFALNILWSVLFFTVKRPRLALFEVVALWLSILSLILHFAPIDSVSGWLLLPYLLWVSFAAYLNLVMVRLNGPAPIAP